MGELRARIAHRWLVARLRVFYRGRRALAWVLRV